MPRKEIDALIELDKNSFDYQEWVALQWVRTYLECEGVFPDPELNREFEHLFSPQERTCVFSIFKLMLFFNMLANTVFRERYDEGAACVINSGQE